MKHIDINPLISAVKNIEFQQTREALRSYGGRCRFDPENAPSVEFYGGNGPASADVREIRLEGDGVVLEVWDETLTDGGTYEVKPTDLYPGSLLGVVDYM